MTTSATTPRLNYTGDGSTTDFTFNYEIADQNSIAVYVGSTRQTLTTDYTVAFNSGTAGTGTVTFLSAPANAADIYLIRETDNIRTTDFQEGGAFLASTINNELDRLTQGIQDLENIIENTTIKIAEPTTETATLTLPDAATRANKQLSFDGSGVLQVTTAGTGTVTSLATGTGLTGGPITTTGTISIDTGTTVDVSTAQTLTNKTLTAPIISTISNTGTLTLPTSTDTLVGRATTDTFTNKSGNISQWTNDSNYLTSATVTVVSDTSPQLGGNLDLNGNTVFGTGNISIVGSLYAGDAVFSGNLTVEGTTTTINTTNLSVEDAFIELNRNNSSTATDADAGIFIRNGYNVGGTDYNPAFYWDHGDQKFRFMITDVDPNTSPASLNDGTLTLANVAMGALSSGGITASGVSNFYGINFRNSSGDDVLNIDDNNITALRSNDNINITPAGTGQVSANAILNVNSNRIINVASPTTGTDAANQDYVDTAIGTINAIAQLDSNVTVTDVGTGSITATADGNLIFTATDAAGLTMSKDIAMGGNSITGLNSLTATGSIANDAVSIDDNVIKTTRSNDNLNIEANGTGQIQIRANGGDFANYSTNARYNNANIMYAEDLADTIGDGVRSYKNALVSNYKLNTGQSSSNSNDRWRHVSYLNFDLNGSSSTATSAQYRSIGLMGLDVWPVLDNSSATAATLGNLSGANAGVSIYPSSTGDITVTNTTGMATYLDVYGNTAANVTITDHVAYESVGIDHYGGGAGNLTITDHYHFRAGAHSDFATGTLSLTNNYGFYFENDSTATNTYAFYDASNSTSVFGDIQTQAVSITDNLITTNRSNDDLLLKASGTGRVEVGDDIANGNFASWWGSDTNIKDFTVARIQTIDADTTGRTYNAAFDVTTTLSNGSSTNNDFRPRVFIANSGVDMNGYDYTVSSFSRGPLGFGSASNIINSSATTASTLATARGGYCGVAISDTNGMTQDLTITNAIALNSQIAIETDSSAATTITNGYGVYHAVYADNYSSGSAEIVNNYGFYTTGTGGTNNYAFYSNSDTAVSRIGSLERYREEINTLTSSSTITVDCGLAPVHTVTLGENTQFVISNLGTGQTATIIITQDGTGNRTASFGTDTSTTVKFPGGVPSLSTGGGDIDIVSVFNDGTNYLGNIAKDYS